MGSIVQTWKENTIGADLAALMRASAPQHSKIEHSKIQESEDASKRPRNLRVSTMVSRIDRKYALLDRAKILKSNASNMKHQLAHGPKSRKTRSANCYGSTHSGALHLFNSGLRRGSEDQNRAVVTSTRPSRKRRAASEIEASDLESSANALTRRSLSHHASTRRRRHLESAPSKLCGNTPTETPNTAKKLGTYSRVILHDDFDPPHGLDSPRRHDSKQVQEAHLVERQYTNEATDSAPIDAGQNQSVPGTARGLTKGLASSSDWDCTATYEPTKCTKVGCDMEEQNAVELKSIRHSASSRRPCLRTGLENNYDVANDLTLKYNGDIHSKMSASDHLFVPLAKFLEKNKAPKERAKSEAIAFSQPFPPVLSACAQICPYAQPPMLLSAPPLAAYIVQQPQAVQPPLVDPLLILNWPPVTKPFVFPHHHRVSQLLVHPSLPRISPPLTELYALPEVPSISAIPDQDRCLIEPAMEIPSFKTGPTDMLKTRKRQPNPPLSKSRKDQNIVAPLEAKKQPTYKPLLETIKERPKFKKKEYSTKGFSRCLREAISRDKMLEKEGHRIIARVKQITESDGSFGVWMPIYVEISSKEPWVYTFSRGGKLTFLPGKVPNIDTVRDEMGQCVFRQYVFRGGFHKEPRVHVLYSSGAKVEKTSDNKMPGYKYHNIKMQALPLDSLPVINELAGELAAMFGISNGEWNIGLDLLCYRDGADGISWHADDTQGEETVVSLVTQSENGPRTLCIQPSNALSVQSGDEHVEIFPAAGDIYFMDREMQQNYVHSIIKFTKGKEVAAGKRMAIVFRHGRELYVPHESAFEVLSTAAPDRYPPEYRFGHMIGLKEGALYSRIELMNSGAHQMDRKGISGKKGVGCNSIVVSKGYPATYMGTDDHYLYLTYSATGNQGAGALSCSMQNRKPIRVFRSSKNFKDQAQADPRGPYSQSVALKFAPLIDGTKYRYDGLYYVTGEEEDAIGGSMKVVTRFRLLRAEPIKGRDCIHRQLEAFQNQPLSNIEIIPDEVSKKEAASIVDNIGPFDPKVYHTLINSFTLNTTIS